MTGRLSRTRALWSGPSARAFALVATIGCGFGACGDDGSDAVPDTTDTTDGADTAADTAVADDASDAAEGDDRDAADVDAASDAGEACAEPPSSVPFDIEPLLVDEPSDGPPLSAVSDVLEVDVDGDGLPEYVLVEPAAERLRIADACESGCRVDATIPIDGQPVRVEAVDLDGDAFPELVVAGIGFVGGSNAPVGSVSVVRRDGNDWEVERVADELFRVACARPEDLDSDGFVDIVVCEFGDVDGHVGVLWGSADGFAYERVYRGAGAVDVDFLDTDGDGVRDIVVAMSQLQEQVITLERSGARSLSPRVLYDPDLVYFGHSSLRVVDLDGDGRSDVLFTNGDPGDLPGREVPEGLHGLNVLWQRDGGQFEYERLADVAFAYATAVGDFDGDCTLDVMVFRAPSMLPDFEADLSGVPPAILVRPAVSGDARAQPVAEATIDVVSARSVDIDADGVLDVVVGQMSVTGVIDGPILYALRNAGTSL